MTSAKYDIIIEQIVPFSLSMVRKNNNIPVDLTAYTALMHIRKRSSNELLVELSTENGRITLGADGTIALSISGPDTATLPETHRAIYDLLLIPNSDPDSPVRILEGNCSITYGVTQP